MTPLRFTLRQLEYLVAVAEAGSIALAAQRINVSPPSISTAITQIEATLGLPLFVRKHAHGLSLTQGGAQCVAQAKQVLAAAAGMNELANTITGTVRGPLHVGCLLTFTQVIVPRLRRGFVDRYPDVTFRQFERDQSAIFAGLRNASLDVALTYDLDLPADLAFTPLLRLPPYVLFDAGHPLARRAQVTPDDLLGYPMVLLDLPFSVDYFQSLFAHTATRPLIAERTRDIAVMHALVANGFGYSIANIRPSPSHAADGQALCAVPLAGDVRPMHLGVLLPQGAQSSMTVRAFVDHCVQHVATQVVVA
jgi:DNA-binding transcriptional LysR family regulator